MELKEHILTEADTLFSNHGIKSVTMDDIAKHLGMSKKTIYLHFQDKNDLINILIKNRLENQECLIGDTVQNSENAIDEVFKCVTEVQAMLSNIHPTFMYDLQKYYTEAWKMFRKFRNESLYKNIYDNLVRGVSEGYYRKDMNLEVLTNLRLETIDLVFNQAIYSIKDYSISLIMKEISEHFLYGISTLEGHQLI